METMLKTRIVLMLSFVMILAEFLRAPQVHLDFAPLYGSACLLKDGRMEDAYEVDINDNRFAGKPLSDITRSHGYPVQHVLRYLHSPALSGLIIPLTKLDFIESAILFRCISLLFLLCASIALTRVAKISVEWGGIISIFFLMFDPERMTLDLGQTNNLVLFLLTCALVCGRPYLSGILLALASIFKLFSLTIAVIWLFSGGNTERRLASMYAFLSFLAIHSIFYLITPEGTFAYVDMLIDLSEYQFLWAEQQSLASIVTRALMGFTERDVIQWTDRVMPALEGQTVGYVWACLVIGFGVLIARISKADTPSVGILGLCSGILASPVLHSHYGLFLALPVIWIVSRNKIDLSAVLVAIGLLFTCLPFHQAESLYHFHYLPELGLHWLYVSHVFLGFVFTLIGVAVGLIKNSS